MSNIVAVEVAARGPQTGAKVRQLVGSELELPEMEAAPEDDALFDAQFTVTDGRAAWPVTLIEGTAGRRPLLAFEAGRPPRDTDLWVVRHTVATPERRDARGTICFTPGTMIETGDGARDVAELSVGDRVQTKDAGCEEILWIGRRRITGARLRAMPHLAPVRLTAGSLQADVPDASLLVSPDHRILLRGPRAVALWSTNEVLVTAKDLVDGQGVFVDRTCREVTYIHLMLSSHQVVFANGVETESFHPALARLDRLDDPARAQLSAAVPDVLDDASLYGGFARRLLTTPEAAILRHA